MVAFDYPANVAVLHGCESVLTTDQLTAVLRPARHRKVAILGFGKSVRHCPWRDESWELWAMNGFYRAAEPDFGITAPPERYTLWFDMHTLAFTREYGKLAGIGNQQEEWLRQPHPFPILALEEFGPEYPDVRAYPIEQIVGELKRDYFTSTVAYAIAYALSQPDVAEIGLWGIDLIHDTEYADQRPCAEYWLGRAEERGIKVTRAEDSAILRQRFRYGYEEEPEFIKALRASLVAHGDKLHAAIEKRVAEIEHARLQTHTDDGALQMVRGLLGQLDGYKRGGKL